MNDDTIGVWHDPEVEVRIVAMVLGEASDFEKAELERMIAEDSGLKQFHVEMSELHGVLPLSVKADDDWKLPPGRRNLVLGKTGQSIESVKVIAVEPSTSGTQWRTLASIAACLLFTLFVMALMLPIEVKEEVREEFETVSFYSVAASDSFDQDEGLVSKDKLERPRTTTSVARKPSAPSSSMSNVIAASTANVTGVGVPDVYLDEFSFDFGNGDDFGDGWRDAKSEDIPRVAAGNRSGDYAVTRDRLDGLNRASKSNLRVSGNVYAKKSLPVDSLHTEIRQANTEELDFDWVENGKSPSAVQKKLAKQEAMGKVQFSGQIGRLSASVDPIEILDLNGAEQGTPTNGVRKNLYKAEGNINLGKYDEAEEAFKEVLREDRYNKAARRGMEKIAGMKSDYYRAAYDQNRAELLMQVDEAWEIAEAPRVSVDGKSKSKRSESFVQREVARRATGVQESDASLLEGRKYYSEGRYESAVASYEKALKTLAKGLAVKDRREAYTSHFVDGSIALADSLKNEGKLEDAKSVLKLALEQDNKNTTLSAKLKELEVRKEKPVVDEISAAEQTHSTFSLNVSDASYKLAKVALLERGEWPAAESVRTEEFINAFDYGDAKPSMAQKVACVQEQAVHPFLQQRNLLRVSMSTAAQGRSTPLNIVVLLDQSGSMERPDRAATALRAMAELGKQLGPNDRVSLMSFARDTRLLVDGLSGDRAGELVEIIKNRPSEGGTNLEQAVQVAQQHLLARQKKGVQSRIVVLTDGAANLGDANPERLTAMVEKMRDAGIAFDACGIGFDGLDDGILEALTRKGDGRYYVLDKPEDADESFGKKIAGALRPAAKNVKVQLVFNPDRVGEYKLLGFEKHRLKKEDFRNDSVDAAEMAAEESGSALYQIETKADGSGELGTVFVRFQDMESGQMVERSWTIPYQEKTKSLAKSKPSIQLAAVAGLLGEKLHQSDAGTVDFSQINNVLGNLSSKFSGNKKVQELLQMVRKVQQ